MPIHVIYARKSTESIDRQVLSIDSQIQELKLTALRQGIAVGEVLTESHSAKAPGRPVFEQLMRRVDRGEIGSILCWKPDRLARNHADVGRVLQALADRTLHSVISPDRTYTGDGNDRFMAGFEFGVAVKFIDDLRANIKRGMRARRERGWPSYRPPIGYSEDPVTKETIKDLVRFDLVRRLWDMLLSEAMRPSQIARYANDELGLRTPKSSHAGGNLIQVQLVYKIFKNRFYLGLPQHRATGEIWTGRWPAMVNQEEFDRAQEILGRSSRPRPSKHEFAYSGMLRCGKCQGILSPELHPRPNGKTYLYYRCRGRLAPRHCTAPTLPEHVLETQILNDLRRLAVPPETGQWILDNLRRDLLRDEARHETTRHSLEAALTATEQEWDRLVTMKQRDQIDDETFEPRRTELQTRKAGLRQKLIRPVATTEQLVDRAAEILEFSTTAPAAFLKAKDDPVGRRQILQAVSSKWIVEGRKCVYLAKEPFSFLSGGGSNIRCLSVVNDVRTWLIKKSEGFRLPDLYQAPATPHAE